MHIVLSRTSGVPMYEQIVEQIRTAIWSGELAPDTPLPSLRSLARELEVSLITTTRAYNDLAAQGLIVNQAGRGSFVLAQDDGETRRRLTARLDEQIDEVVATARLAGIDHNALQERVTASWRQAQQQAQDRAPRTAPTRAPGAALT
ncbi:GntR family transcriptional regulator [Actinomyces oricola]